MAQQDDQQQLEDNNEQSPYKLNSTTGAASQPSQAQTQQSQPGSGRFQGIQGYLNANQGLGAQSAQRAAATAGNAYSSANSSLQNLTQQYDQQARAGAHTFAYQPAAPQQTAQPAAPAAPVRRSAGPGVSGQAPLAATNATNAGNAFAGRVQGAATRGGQQLVVDPFAMNDRSAEAQAASTAAYTGPNALTDVTGYGDTSDLVNNAQNYADALKSPQTLQALLGGGALDGALAQHEGAGTLNDAYTRFGGIQKALADATANTAPSDSAKNATAAGRMQAQQYLGDSQAAQAAKDSAALAKENDTTAQIQASHDSDANYQAYLKKTYSGLTGNNHMSQSMFDGLSPESQQWLAQNAIGQFDTRTMRGLPAITDTPGYATLQQEIKALRARGVQ